MTTERQETSVLQQLRESAGLGRERLAAMAGCSSQTIYNLENGQRPRLHTARAISKALGLHVDQVFPDGLGANEDEQPGDESHREPAYDVPGGEGKRS